jgi:hypothetical protein
MMGMGMSGMGMISGMMSSSPSSNKCITASGYAAINAELDKYYIGKSPAMAGDEGLKKICDLRLITLTALLL